MMSSVADSEKFDQDFKESLDRSEDLAKQQDNFCPLPNLPNPDPFPFDALGDIPGAAAKKMHTTIKAADSVCGLSVLIALSLVTQAHANVDIGHGAKPLSLYGLTVAESGERKSAVDKAVTEAIREWQKLEERCYFIDKEAHLLEKELWDKKKKEALVKPNAQQLIRELSPSPVAPLLPYMICEEPTYEGLVRLLSEGQPAVGIFSDEGARLVGGHAFSEENKLKTGAGLSSIWDAGEISRVRQAEGSMVLRGRRVAVHLMLQEVALQKLVQGGVLEKQGLLSRCLIVQPELCAGSRKYVAEHPHHAAELLALKSILSNLLDRPLPIDQQALKKNELDPRILTCGIEAKEMWVEYYHEVEFQSGQASRYGIIRSFASKSAEQAYRIAGVLTLAEEIEAADISLKQMQNGIILARYFLNEALRIFSVAAISNRIKNARALFDWLVGNPQRGEEGILFSMRTLRQFGPNQLRDPVVLQEAIGVLVEYRYLSKDGAKIMLLREG